MVHQILSASRRVEGCSRHCTLVRWVLRRSLLNVSMLIPHLDPSHSVCCRAAKVAGPGSTLDSPFFIVTRAAIVQKVTTEQVEAWSFRKVVCVRKESTASFRVVEILIISRHLLWFNLAGSWTPHIVCSPTSSQCNAERTGGKKKNPEIRTRGLR